jgi:putative SOS response-associated peptidase YedK
VCGRFTLTTDLDAVALAALFGAQSRVRELRPRYNIAPTQPAVAVRVERGRRVLDALRWGLMPAWARDRSVAGRLINARAETLERRSAFRDAFSGRRCLIPSDGFYEWGGRERTPHWIRLRDGAPFAYAGLYERGSGAGEDDTTPATFTIVTTEPNELVGTLHDRMPVIIAPDRYDRWLDPSRSTDELRALLRPYPAAKMTMQPVARTVNHAEAEGPACVFPAPAPPTGTNVNLELFEEGTHGQT